MTQELVFKRVKKDPTAQAILKAAEEGYQKHARESKWLTKKSFAPSALVYGHGKCPRYWGLAFNGAYFSFENDSDQIANMKNGTDSHTRLQSVFMRSGILAGYEGTEDTYQEGVIKNSDPPIYGYLDLLFDIDGEQYPGEIKTSKSEAFEYRKKNKKGSHYHTVQLLIYLKVLKKQKGFLVYEDKQTYELLLVPVEMTPENEAYVDYLFDWMRQVYKAHKEGNLPKRGFRRNNKICNACPVREACESSEVGELKLPTLEVKL